MTFASIFVFLVVFNTIGVSSIVQVRRNRTEANNMKDISFDFSCKDTRSFIETCSVTLHMKKTLSEVIDEFSDLIKDNNATMVRFWLRFPKYDGFNPMLVNTSTAYGLWLWHWLSDRKGESLLLLPHSAEFYSFTTLFLRGPEFEILFRDYNGSSKEIAHLPDCCKLGLVGRVILKITNSSVNNGRKESNRLCHRYVAKPETDDAKVHFRCCHMVNFWDKQDDCYEQLEESIWIKGIAISGVILTIILWVTVLPVACWYIISAAITEQPIVKKFRRKENDTCRKESDLECEKVTYRKESDLVPRCTIQPITIATIASYWQYPSQGPDANPRDASSSQKSKYRSKCNLFKKLVAVAYFVLVVPVCVILLVIIGPIFLGFTDVEVKAWTMSTGFPAPNYEWGLFMPYPFETWRIVTVCTLYATYSLACAVFILMFGDTLGTALCVKHQHIETRKSNSIELEDKTDIPFTKINSDGSNTKLWYPVSEKYQHFFDTIKYKSIQHLLVNVLVVSRKLQINSLISLTKPVNTPKWLTNFFKNLPPVTFFILIYEITKCNAGNGPKNIIFSHFSFLITLTLLAYFILLISLWIVLYCFGFTMMGIALNPDKLASKIVVVLTIFGYVLTIYYSFVKSYKNVTKKTFEMLLTEGSEERRECVEYVTDEPVSRVCKEKDAGAVQDAENDTVNLRPLVFLNVIYAESERQEDCILKDALCYVFNKIKPVHHELGFALMKISLLVVFIIFAFFVIQSFGVHPALETALTAIISAVPAVFKARGAASSQTNATNDLLSSKIRCALDKYKEGHRLHRSLSKSFEETSV